MNPWGLMLGAVAALAALGGCGPAGPWREHFRDTLAGEKAVTSRLSAPRELAMFDGHDGLALAWDDLMEAVRLADAVVVGERHTDAAGHEVELAIAQDALANWPKTAVSMEMLVRSDQAAADDYLAGKVVHLVGQFHIDFDGGLADQLRRREPGLSILTISLVPVHSRRLRREDRGRADVVVYTEVFKEGSSPSAAEKP